MMETCENSSKDESETTSFTTTTAAATATTLPIQMIQSHLGLNSHQLQALLQQQQHLLAFHQVGTNGGNKSGSQISKRGRLLLWPI